MPFHGGDQTRKRHIGLTMTRHGVEARVTYYVLHDAGLCLYKVNTCCSIVQSCGFPISERCTPRRCGTAVLSRHGLAP